MDPSASPCYLCPSTLYTASLWVEMSLLLSPSDFTGTWLLICCRFDAAQRLCMPCLAISASRVRLHEGNPPSSPHSFKASRHLNRIHLYFHFRSATLPCGHTLDHPQKLAPCLKAWTLVFHSVHDGLAFGGSLPHSHSIFWAL